MFVYKLSIPSCLILGFLFNIYTLAQSVDTDLDLELTDISSSTDNNCTNCQGNCSDNGFCEKDCNVGFYGLKCNLTCAESCKNTCNRTNGVCEFCEDGYFGEYCNEICSKNCSEGCGQGTGICIKCPFNRYGDFCENVCGEHCVSGCDSKTGSCPFCRDGFWGTNCSNRCAENCVGECYKYRGDCFHCKSGYGGVNCQHKCSDANCESCYIKYNDTDACRTCKAGWYGAHCTEECNDHCKDNTCVMSDGSCDCSPGWFGLDCNHACMNNCVSCGDYTSCYKCKDGYYGEKCNFRCPDYCSACSRDGNECKYSACKQSNDYNSHCECKLDECQTLDRFRFCVQCKNDSWYTSRRGCCPCSEQCNGPCDNKTGICINGCEDGYYGDMCDIKCSEHCQGGVDNCSNITGLCLNGCEPDWYKPTCDFKCSFNYPHCKTCGLITVGTGYGVTCNECEEGYRFWDGNCIPCDVCIDGKCTETFGCETGCVPGSFGMYCVNKCQRHCYACDKVFGQCLICRSKYTGQNCQTPCPDCVNPYENSTSQFRGACPAGKYGIHCNQTCGNCQSIKSGETAQCDRITGSCFAGCLQGYYGFPCVSACHHCMSSTTGYRWCDSRSGVCRRGCTDGYFGSLCNNSCSPYCGGNGTCDQSSGRCLHGCLTGWQGLQCDDKIHNIPAKLTGGLTNLQIAGVVIGSVLGAIGIVVVIALLYRRKSKLEHNAYSLNDKDTSEGRISYKTTGIEQ